jgi:hypothetical protein
MDFSIPTLFVVPVGNTLPTTGSTQNLNPGQFGIFRNDYTAATAGNVAGVPYIYLAQGRQFQIPGTGTKRSDKIAAGFRIKNWYVVPGEPQAALQITQVNNFTVPCGVPVTLTLRLFSSYIETGFFNGLTRSITVMSPCCECGASPCTDVDPQGLVDAFVAESLQDELLKKYVTLTRIGTGVNSVLQISANPLTKYGVPCDVAAFPFEFDRIYFYTFIYQGPDTTQDFLVYPDACNQIADVGILQRSTYPKGTSDEVYQMEKNYNSYQTPDKSLFRAGGLGTGYNGTFEDFVTPGTTYDMLYLKYYPVDDDSKAFDPVLAEFAEDIIEVPTALTSGIQAILTAYLGNPTDESGTPITTTTTTSTSTSSTTTTTTTGQEP